VLPQEKRGLFLQRLAATLRLRGPAHDADLARAVDKQMTVALTAHQLEIVENFAASVAPHAREKMLADVARHLAVAQRETVTDDLVSLPPRRSGRQNDYEDPVLQKTEVAPSLASRINCPLGTVGAFLARLHRAGFWHFGLTDAYMMLCSKPCYQQRCCRDCPAWSGRRR
jgi:hypothetical protein